MSRPSPADSIAWWAGNELRVAVFLGEEKRRLRLVDPGGKELRVPPNRLAFRIEPGGERDAKSWAKEIDRRVRERADACDVALLWELALEAGEPLPSEELAELALGARDGLHRAATIRAMLHDGIHFTRKADMWEPRTAETVGQLLHQRERAARRRAQRRGFLDGLGNLAKGEPWEPEADPVSERYLAALHELAVHDLDAADAIRTAALEALQAWGVRYDHPAEGAFRLLRALGRFESDDVNLDLVRHEIPETFAPEVLERATALAARGFPTPERRDLTALDAFTVDGPGTTEIDDALSYEPLADGVVRVGVHIADPDAFIEAGDAVDEAARDRGLTHYLPDRKILMFPGALSEVAASLVPGEPRPAVSFLVELADDGELTGFEVCRSIIRSVTALSYAELDRALAGESTGPPLDPRPLFDVLEARGRRRADAGAIAIDAPEVEVRVESTGTISLRRTPAGSRARLGVGEAMVLVGTVAARLCVQHDVPALFRRQPAPDKPVELPDGPIDPVESRRLRMTLRRGETSLAPGRHFALGLDAYLQATSPLRRFHDLINQRQLLGALTGNGSHYDGEALQALAALTSRAERTSRQVGRSAHRYWMLRYLERAVGSWLEGVVVETQPRPLVQLDETLLEQPVHALRGVPLGERVRLRVERVNPRAGLLVLRP